MVHLLSFVCYQIQEKKLRKVGREKNRQQWRVSVNPKLGGLSVILYTRMEIINRVRQNFGLGTTSEVYVS